MTTTCSVPACARRHYARGLCSGHYQRFRTTGRLGGTSFRMAEPGAPCRVSGCSQARRAHGLCVFHLKRSIAGKSLLAPKQSRETHGLTDHPLYPTWGGMVQRCTNPNNDNYARYGGRGIQVCGRWRVSFAAFLADVGERPSPKHSLDRRDTNGHYEPGNIRWATKLEQGKNTRRTKMTPELARDLRAHVDAGGSIRSWSRAHGISHTACGNAYRFHIWD
jgi:hypothetical protein